jgi:hypothetical protein
MLGCSAWKTPRYAKETSLNLVLSNSLMFACYWPQDCFSVSQVAAERLLMQTLEELRRPKPDEHKAWHKPDMVCDMVQHAATRCSKSGQHCTIDTVTLCCAFLCRLALGSYMIGIDGSVPCFVTPGLGSALCREVRSPFSCVAQNDSSCIGVVMIRVGVAPLFGADMC